MKRFLLGLAIFCGGFLFGQNSGNLQRIPLDMLRQDTKILISKNRRAEIDKIQDYLDELQRRGACLDSYYERISEKYYLWHLLPYEYIKQNLVAAWKDKA